MRGWDRLMTTLAGKVAIDVGANTGGVVNTLLEHGAKSVIAIEPGPALALGLRSRYALDRRVDVLNVGLSDAAGVLEGVRHHSAWTLVRPGEKRGRLLETSPEAEKIEGSGTFDVELFTLDEVVKGMVRGTDRLGFVKVDTDGYDAKVLRGARETLKSLRPPLFLELSYLPGELGDSILAFVADIYRAGYVIATTDEEVATEEQVLENYPWHTSVDVLCMPEELTRGWSSFA